MSCRKCSGVTRYEEWGLCDGCHEEARYHFNECPGCGLTEREDVEGPLDSYSSFYCKKCDGDWRMLPFNQAVARITAEPDDVLYSRITPGRLAKTRGMGCMVSMAAQYPWERHEDLPRDEGWVLDHNGEWRQA